MQHTEFSKTSWIVACWFCSLKREVFQWRNEVVYFEDNEALIKMIMKGRSPNLRHISRSHRVPLDWFVRQNQFRSKDSDQVCWLQESTRTQIDIRTCELHYLYQTSSLFDISHVMHGTTFYVCLILAFSALKAALSSILKSALKLWQRDNKKVIMMKESSPNQSQSEIWYRGAVRCHQRRHLRRYLQA